MTEHRLSILPRTDRFTIFVSQAMVSPVKAFPYEALRGRENIKPPEPPKSS